MTKQHSTTTEDTKPSKPSAIGEESRDFAVVCGHGEFTPVLGSDDLHRINLAISVPEMIKLTNDREIVVRLWEPTVAFDKIVTVKAEGLMMAPKHALVKGQVPLELPEERPQSPDGRQYGIVVWAPTLSSGKDTTVYFAAEILMERPKDQQFIAAEVGADV